MPKVTEAHFEARRQQILGAAFACFARDGFHQTTMQNICREADLSPGAVYRYFDSKEAIIEASCEAEQQATATHFTAARQKGDTLQVLDELVSVYFIGIDRPESDSQIRLNLQVWVEALRNPQIKDTVHRCREDVVGHIEEIIRRAQERGEINPDLGSNAVARVLMSTYDGLVLQKSIEPDLDVGKYAEALKALYGGTFWQGDKP